MKRLKSGNYSMRLVVSAEVAQFAARQAIVTGCLGPEDYLASVLNIALLDEMPVRLKSIPRMKTPPNPLPDRGDLDDGIPF